MTLKNLIITTFLSSFSLSAFAQANEEPICSGDGIISNWQTRFATSFKVSYIHISNLSNADMFVQIELHDQNGNIYNESSEAGAQFAFDPSSGITTSILEPLSDVLGAGKSTYVSMRAGPNQKYGWGVIHWVSFDPNCRNNSMTATLQAITHLGDRYSETNITINNGLPF